MSRLLVLWIALLCAFSASADENHVVVVPVPKSELDLEPIRASLSPPAEFEISASNFFPARFSRGGHFGDSTYDGIGMPFLSLNRLSEFQTFANGISLASKFGVSYLGLKRSTESNVGDYSTGRTDQQINILLVRLGVESGWARLLPWGFEPSLGVALLPAWEFGEQSRYEDGVSGVGFPLEGTLGLLWRSSARGESGSFSFGLEAQEIYGAVGGSKMNGAGLQGEFRISL
jgi:hypothetical protein